MWCKLALVMSYLCEVTHWTCPDIRNVHKIHWNLKKALRLLVLKQVSGLTSLQLLSCLIQPKSNFAYLLRVCKFPLLLQSHDAEARGAPIWMLSSPTLECESVTFDTGHRDDEEKGWLWCWGLCGGACRPPPNLYLTVRKNCKWPSADIGYRRGAG